MLLCPMKWTTTLDFIEQFSMENLSQYDHIILYTGIVEWSPRPVSSARTDLYNNKVMANLENLELNTRDYSKKIINNKKEIFDSIFGASEMEEYLSRPFDTLYEGQATINMYGLDMARDKLIAVLARIPNLIFITANRFVPGWEGDFKRGRPENIRIIEKYSDLFATELTKAGVPILDLRTWTLDEVNRYTCDNMHLTKLGSDWIYDQLVDLISNSRKTTSEIKPMNKYILLIGNGQSTKELVEFGLENLPKEIDTFGMGAAYRYFERVNWWPDYHAWCDMKVVHSHRASFKRIAEDASIPLKKLFLSLPISSADRLECVPHSSTGDFCFRKALEMGYESIFIIGIEGDYIEEIAESRPLKDHEYERLGFESAFEFFSKDYDSKSNARDLFKKYLRVVTETPKRNPNYFFDDYQQKGDVYSLPRTQTHINAWAKTAVAAQNAGALTFNLSQTSKIVDFPKITLKGALQRISDKATGKRPVVPFGYPIEVPRLVSMSLRNAALKSAGLGPKDRLGALIIGLKVSDGDTARHRNLRFLLDWIDAFYGDLFEVLIVEQGVESRLGKIATEFRPYVKHKFIYNPGPYNRGWGYNVAALWYTEANVIALLDTDVLLGANFLDEIISCHQKYDVISPYSSVYFTDEPEADEVCQTFSLDGLQRNDGVKKPTTITGGIVIIRRDTFLQIKGFEQYTEYAGEDRALDVTILNHLPAENVRMAPFTYVHLYHVTGLEDRPRSRELCAHLKQNFGCFVDPNVRPGQDIHMNCKHANRKQTLQLMIARASSFGDLDLYRGNKSLTINGLINRCVDSRKLDGVVFPPALKDVGIRDLSKYSEKEITGDLHKLDAECMSQFFNMFKGERCFIIGNGPSLNRHDLSLLEGEYTFGVNSFYYKTRETGYRPFFYVVEDTSVMNENIDEIRSYYAPFRFFPTSYRGLLPPSSNTFFFRMNRGFYEKSSPNYSVPRFSTDASDVLFCGQTVTYINLQLAFFMGFTQVYLIGMDFDYVIPDSHERKGDIILSTTDDPNHFHKDYFGAGKTWKDPKLDRVLMNYRMADLAYSAVGRKIYNATIGGKLEIFERVDYEKLLREPKTERNLDVFTDQSAKVNRGEESVQNSTSPRPMHASSINLTTHLLLDPKVFLPKVETGGVLHSAAEAILRQGGFAAEHFIKVRDLARRKCART